MKRLSRAEQNERNRGLVLEAARRIFLARGYHAATLDEIADEAGFSRGVVQSRFGNNQAELDWGLLLIEFRVHAARDADLGRRYAELHARARQALAGVITGIYERAGQPPPFGPEEMAQMMLTVEAGIRLEQAAEPGRPEASAGFERLRGFIESPLASGDGARKARRSR